MSAKVSNEQRKTPGRKKTSQKTKNVFRDRLNERITKKNILTNEDLGKALGISTAQAGKYRNGSIPDPDMLKNISEKFDTSIDYLLGISDDHHRDTNAGDYLGISGESVEALKKAIAEYKKSSGKHDIDDIYKTEILDVIFQSDFLEVLTEAIEDRIAYRDVSKVLEKIEDDLLNDGLAQKNADEKVDDAISSSEYHSNRQYQKLIDFLSFEIGSYFSAMDIDDIEEAGSLDNLADIINAKNNSVLNSAFESSRLFPYGSIFDYWEMDHYIPDLPSKEELDEMNRYADEVILPDEEYESFKKALASLEDERMDSEDE